VTLIDGGCFTEALRCRARSFALCSLDHPLTTYHPTTRLCYLHKRKDLVETHLQPASLEQCEKWKNKIEKKHKRFLRHKERLPIARGIMRAKMQDAETYGGTTTHQPPPTSHQPPATSHQPPATSHHLRVC
jgi:hypothetical protein